MRINDRWNKRAYARKTSKGIAPMHRHKGIASAHTVADGNLCEHLTVCSCIAGNHALRLALY